MYHHRLIVSYKGSNYFGWQNLGASEEKPTIEATIQQVLKKICKYQPSVISSASRTDAGVHAQGQVLKVTIPRDIHPEKLLLGMNSLLPDDIRVVHCESSTIDFNPNKDSMSKEYHYHFFIDNIHNPLLNDTVAHIPSTSRMTLDISLIQEACKLFIGEHDFYSFAKRDTTMHSTFRTVLSCELVQTPSTFTDEIYTIKIVGTGFLRYMVRYIVGALFALGRNEIKLTDISNALTNHNDKKLSAKAKSSGLHLIEVYY